MSAKWRSFCVGLITRPLSVRHLTQTSYKLLRVTLHNTPIFTQHQSGMIKFKSSLYLTYHIPYDPADVWLQTPRGCKNNGSKG